MDQVSICWSWICRLNCNHRSLILKVWTPLSILSLFFPTGFCSRHQRLGLVLWAVWERLQSGSAAVGASWCAHVSWCCFESWHHTFPRSVSRERCRPGKYKQIVSVIIRSLVFRGRWTLYVVILAVYGLQVLSEICWEGAHQGSDPARRHLDHRHTGLCRQTPGRCRLVSSFTFIIFTYAVVL